MSQPVHERIVHLFEAEGIDTLFGIPDPGFMHMAMYAEARGWNVIAPHHEQAGGFMADAWSRMTGKPGVVFGTSGPGAANLAAAMISASKENSPTIFLGGNRSRAAHQKIKRGRIQFLNQRAHFAEAMKFVGIVEEAEQLDEIVHEAFRKAMSGKPGPVYVELPASVIHQTRDWPKAPPPTAYRLVHQAASAPMIDQAVALIRAAKNPVLLVGQGMFTARAHEAVGELAKVLACPVLQTSGCLMVIDGLHDRTFKYGFSPAGVAAAAESDLCIALGTELGETLHFGIGRHWAANNANRKWIYIERDPTAIGVNRAIDVPLVGDLRDIVPQLVEALREEPRKPSPQLAQWINTDAEYRKSVVDSVPSNTELIHPGRFIIEATKSLPKDTILARDGGAVCIFDWTYSQHAASDVLWNQNTGHLGAGLPYAIGACIAAGNKRPALLITGDSSLLFHISELETAVRKNLRVICVVGCDYAWGLEVGVYRKQIGLQSAETEVHWGNWVRFDQIAKGFGAHGEYVERQEDIGPAVQRALASNKTAVIQVPIDARANAMDAPHYEEFKSWLTDFGAGYGDHK